MQLAGRLAGDGHAFGISTGPVSRPLFHAHHHGAGLVVARHDRALDRRRAAQRGSSEACRLKQPSRGESRIGFGSSNP